MNIDESASETSEFDDVPENITEDEFDELFMS